MAQSTGRCSFVGNELLVAMKCYFDGSQGEDDSGAQWLTLAGYAATDLVWKSFDHKWQTMLRERYPIAPYLHMWEIISGTDPFERRAGWTREKVSALIIDSLMLLQNMDKVLFKSTICSVDLSARDRLIGEGYKVQDPYSLCADMCVGDSARWFINKEKPEPMYFFFDRGEKFMGDLKKRWLDGRTPPGKISVDPTKVFWDAILDIQELDMERHPPLQAADMLAWARTRSLSEEERDWKHLAHIMRQVIPSGTAIITEDIMRSKSVRIASA